LKRHDPDSARAWIVAKRVLALLIEEMLGAAEHFSPWGCAVHNLRAPHQPQPAHVGELCAALLLTRMGR